MDTSLQETKIQTLEHIARVQHYLNIFIKELIERAENHDKSKLSESELPAFAEVSNKLKASTYGSEEYNGFLKQLGPALECHYRSNSHHPQFYKNGIRGMDLIDIIEMFADWCAAVERHDNGNIHNSIEFNKTRFNYDSLLADIMTNTADRYIKGNK